MSEEIHSVTQQVLRWRNRRTGHDNLFLNIDKPFIQADELVKKFGIDFL